MAEREWKPGDVARLTMPSGMEHIALRVCWPAADWISATEGGLYGATKIRPLVVIDPEDREQVASLVELLVDNGWRCTTAHGLRDALREFADPTTRPDEPQGWLAAVEDPRTDQRWYRDGATDATHRWRQQRNDGIHARNTWDELPRTVRIVSEGVTP